MCVNRKLSSFRGAHRRPSAGRQLNPAELRIPHARCAARRVLFVTRTGAWESRIGPKPARVGYPHVTTRAGDNPPSHIWWMEMLRKSPISPYHLGKVPIIIHESQYISNFYIKCFLKFLSLFKSLALNRCDSYTCLNLLNNLKLRVILKSLQRKKKRETARCIKLCSHAEKSYEKHLILIFLLLFVTQKDL